jgi:F-type H+-transporting ATPase subunit delta
VAAGNGDAIEKAEALVEVEVFEALQTALKA